jgi:hypothetical protein
MAEGNPPFIPEENRPDLTVIAGGSGAAEPRDVGTVLGTAAPKPIEKLIAKEGIKDILKDHKDIKEHKDQKEHKDAKDHKDPKEHKDQKDHKDPKDHKDQKDHKDTKDHKDPKEHKDQKDHKDHKDLKDHIEKAVGIEKSPQIEVVGPGHVNPGDPVQGGVGGVVDKTGLTPGKA